MRARLLLLTIALLIGVAVAATAQVGLRITNFRTEIDIQSSGELSIVETLDVTYFTPYHGIERFIPVSYRRSTGESLSIAVRVAPITVDGAAAESSTFRSGANLVIRIGDPNRTITGAHTYVIRYSVGRALLFRKDYVELYWNATGNDWDMPIDHALAAVQPPASVAPADVSTTSYVGYTGSAGRGLQAQVDTQGRFIFEASALSPGEGLTIDLSIPRSVAGIAAPTVGDRILWFLGANKYAFLPLVVLVGMFLLWLKKGKDPAKGTIAPRFDPPAGMDAGEAGVLVDDRVDLRDISAMVVDLAVRGHLKIQEVREEELGVAGKVTEFFRHSAPLDYEFVKTKPKPGSEALSKAEQTVLDAMFDAAHPEKRSLSSLENEFYKTLPSLKSNLYATLIGKGYYRANPERVRRSYSSAGGALIAAGIGLGIVASSLYLGAAIVVSGLVVLAFSPIMPRKTRKGVDALQDLRGLAEYIQRAEVKQMEFHDVPEKSPALFEKLLPYAIALNLTGVWTKQFEGLLKEPPEWYVGRASVFNGPLFALSMLNLSSGMQRTFVSAPRTSPTMGGRSAWSGGGHFGGGFSGGGFGGGGGRGW